MSAIAPVVAREIYRRQAGWFAPERNRLLRQAGIADKKRVLDLGAGTGEMLSDLDCRAAGCAVGLDCDFAAIRLAAGQRVTARAQHMPFPESTFDLVFTQMFFLWAAPLDRVIGEIWRVLEPGGHLVAAAEPDYGGIIEYPEGSGCLNAYAASLDREGADIHIGRRLGEKLEQAGFRVECGIHPARPLDIADFRSSGLDPVSPALAPASFAFVPYFHFLAIRR